MPGAGSGPGTQQPPPRPPPPPLGQARAPSCAAGGRAFLISKMRERQEAIIRQAAESSVTESTPEAPAGAKRAQILASEDPRL